MTIYDKAEQQIVNYSNLHPRLPFRAALLHTNGGGANLRGWWQQTADSGSHIGAQYQVMNDGRVICYVDPAYVVYHAYGASEWAFGIETEDDGENAHPWTDVQLNAIAAVLHFHGVPAVRLGVASAGAGVGTHQDFHEWNYSYHDCVGAVRQAQVSDVLIRLAKLGGASAHATVSPVQSPAMYGPPFQGRVLVKGESGSDVWQWQTMMVKRGWTVVVDGQYGPGSVKVCLAFQAEKGLAQDGCVGPQTWNACRTLPR